MTQSAPPLLSRLVAVADLPSSGLAVTVTPTAEERAALAVLNGLVAVRAMTATLDIRPEGRTGVRVLGELRAAITQICVVSLDPFDSEVREAIDVHCLQPEALDALRAAQAHEGLADDEIAAEEPDLISHGTIDVGALVAEHLTLGLDPYPKKPGAALPSGATTSEQTTSPFGMLRTLNEKRS